MPTIAVYLRANEYRLLQERGLDVKPWLRSGVNDFIYAELNGETPPEANYIVQLRRKNRLELLRILRDIVEEGTVLDVASLTKMIESVE